MPKVLQIHSSDDVAVALEPIETGGEVSVNGVHVAALQTIPPGHKIALHGIRAGDDVLKYGCPIGRAISDIEAGSWVHTHNVQTKLESLLEYEYQPAPSAIDPAQLGPAPTFLGFRRPDGRVAIRNELWIVVT
ncbi:MAG: SAF domain-containing protein, partial [Gammaproteobacteria bacterium]